ncbi:MAG: urease accessory protein [Acidobacteria bacterium]|nr:MAG: urease accessory protein [Acidobacteriota bacterium]
MNGMLATVLGVGFVLGLRHALDPDHVVAVTTMASEKTGVRRTSMIGALWGLGHALSLGLAGGAILALRLSVPPSMGEALEASVGLMLVALGTVAVRRALRWRLHAHPHAHDGEVHVHFHAHSPGRPEAHHHAHLLGGGLRPFLVGLVHGLAGSAGLALLALSAAPSLTVGLAYLAVFSVGSIAGMLILSGLMSLPLGYLEARYAASYRGLQLVAGGVSVAFGLYLLAVHSWAGAVGRAGSS